MNSNSDNSNLPTRRDADDDAQNLPATDAQAVMGFLPPTGTIDEAERIPLARQTFARNLELILWSRPIAASNGRSWPEPIVR